MKITRRQFRRLIKEEISVLLEQTPVEAGEFSVDAWPQGASLVLLTRPVESSGAYLVYGYLARDGDAQNLRDVMLMTPSERDQLDDRALSQAADIGQSLALSGGPLQAQLSPPPGMVGIISNVGHGFVLDREMAEELGLENAERKPLDVASFAEWSDRPEIKDAVWWMRHGAEPTPPPVHLARTEEERDIEEEINDPFLGGYFNVD